MGVCAATAAAAMAVAAGTVVAAVALEEAAG